MKAPARMFQLSDWYGADWDHKKPVDDLWVSPWAKAHYKLRQQEIEIEQCEYMLKQAVEAEDFAEADGLRTRVERLRSQHPITPREERLTEAIEEQNFALAQVFQNDLDAVKTNLGLPKYNVGQAIKHAHREGLRGIVLDVDLQCGKGRSWIHEAGCLERGCAVDMPSEEMDISQLRSWANQPFYLVLLDLAELKDEQAAEEGAQTWRWKWPRELAAWEVNHFAEVPAPLYLPEEALVLDFNDEAAPSHPEMDAHFSTYEMYPHRGRVYQPTPRLRLWQQQRQKDEQESRRQRGAFDISSKNPYDRMR